MIKTLILLLALTTHGLAVGSLSNAPKGDPPKEEPSKIPVIKGLPLKVTTYGTDLIVHFEVGGHTYYSKAYARPIHPGNSASGVTWGIGYDSGYNTAKEIRDDWKEYVDSKELALMIQCAGLKGNRAKWKQQQIRWKVHITYEQAMAVFIKRTMPRFCALAKKYCPDIINANPYIQDAVVSNGYNRGWRTSGYSRRHVKAITVASREKKFHSIPQIIRDSKVIWQNHSMRAGIQRRREWEAQHGEGRGRFIKN